MKIISFLSTTLYLPEHEVTAFINTAPYRYKEYSIPKRNGTGTRQIAQPSSELKVLQALAIEKIKNNFPIHSSAMAYREGLSIKDNASMHANNKFLLKMDFENFFHSILPHDLLLHTEKYHSPISEEDKKNPEQAFLLGNKTRQKTKTQHRGALIPLHIKHAPIRLRRSSIQCVQAFRYNLHPLR